MKINQSHNLCTSNDPWGGWVQGAHWWLHKHFISVYNIKNSSLASRGQGAECPSDSKKFATNWGKEEKLRERREKIRKKEQKWGRKGKNKKVLSLCPSWQRGRGLATPLIKNPNNYMFQLFVYFGLLFEYNMFGWSWIWHWPSLIW